MTTIAVEDAQRNLSQVIRGLLPGEPILLTEGGRPVAALSLPPGQPPRQPRKLGGQRGSVLYMSPDFDAPLEDFREYME